MKHVATDLGFSTADADRVRLSYDGSGLTLHFIDWREVEQEHRFEDVIGFHWDDELSGSAIRDDHAYEVSNSTWLEEQLDLASINSAALYAHYKLCFNANGVLDVLCRRQSTS